MNIQHLVVADTCILINFIRVDRFDLLVNYPAVRLIITEEVLEELTEPSQRNLVFDAINKGSIDSFGLEKPETVRRFAELELVMGRGEASAIAAAESEGWYVATDEGSRARRTIDEGPCGGRLMTTPGLLLNLVKSGVLGVEEANKIKQELETHRFTMNFASFEDLL